MTPIERVREALGHAEECARNEYSRHIYKEALRELEGKVIVPVEPTREMIKAAWVAQYLNIGADMTMAEKFAEIRVEDTKQKSQDCLAYEAMIAPYRGRG